MSACWSLNKIYTLNRPEHSTRVLKHSPPSRGQVDAKRAELQRVSVDEVFWILTLVPVQFPLKLFNHEIVQFSWMRPRPERQGTRSTPNSPGLST